MALALGSGLGLKLRYNTSVFIFRRDLRLTDNTALIEAIATSTNIIPLFILTPAQVSEKNKYKSSNCIQFMMESLEDLNSQLKGKLWVFYSDELDALNDIYNKIRFDAVFFNRDYTPYALKRDKDIIKWCKQNDVQCATYHDCLLCDTLDVHAKNGNYYNVFSQFHNNASQLPIRPVRKAPSIKIVSISQMGSKYSHCTISKQNEFLLNRGYYEINDDLAQIGGRKECQRILSTMAKFKSYDKTHDYPAIDTTQLSAHNKFGTCSIREVYIAFKLKAKNKSLVKQLYWRDFYYYVGYHYPRMFAYEHITKTGKAGVDNAWTHSTKLLNAWKDGMTGYPLVDAGMRQMNKTGYMHNRCRMSVAMFLTKDLLINWKLGEEYFSEKLVDIDRSQNVGNWNWSSSFGLDHTSFLRIFNPWTQAKEYDSQCEYIKEWVPELANVPTKDILNWNKTYENYPEVKYPKPIVEHETQRMLFKNFYKKYFSR
jgi:deoxyribodipyrimidine photo-lyase